MLKNTPYSALLEDKRAYAILLLRDQHGKTFADIAKEYAMSYARVTEIYHRHKVRQVGLYIRHIAAVLECEDTTPIRKVYEDAYTGYQDRACACAYLEKTYADILNVYRKGEPGMPPGFIEALPPLLPEPGKETIARVVELREMKKASYAAIAKELHMTRAKARYIYDGFYNDQAWELVEALQEEAESREEKWDIWLYWFGKNMSSKRRFDLLTKD